MSSQLHALAVVPWGKKPWYSLNRMLQTQKWFGCFVEVRSLGPAGNLGPQFLSYSGHSLLTILTQVSQLCNGSEDNKVDKQITED
jgi:hypothetical protein